MPTGDQTVMFHLLEPLIGLAIEVEAVKFSTLVLRYIVVLKILVHFRNPFGGDTDIESRNLMAEAAELSRQWRGKIWSRCGRSSGFGCWWVVEDDRKAIVA